MKIWLEFVSVVPKRDKIWRYTAHPAVGADRFDFIKLNRFALKNTLSDIALFSWQRKEQTKLRTEILIIVCQTRVEF